MLAPMREMSVTEQRYQVVLAVIAEGRAVMEVASQWGVSRRTVPPLVGTIRGAGAGRVARPLPSAGAVSPPDGRRDRSHGAQLRRAHRYWGARRVALELVRKGVIPAPSESAVYRCLVRAGVIDPVKRHRRKEM